MSVIIAGRDWTRNEMREFAMSVKNDHDPLMQGHGYHRCERCNYSRHPCDTYDLACMLLAML